MEEGKLISPAGAVLRVVSTRPVWKRVSVEAFCERTKASSRFEVGRYYTLSLPPAALAKAAP